MTKYNVCHRTLYTGHRAAGVLSYFVTKDRSQNNRKCNYGIGIRFSNIDKDEEAFLTNITSSYRRVRFLIHILSRGYVTPVTLSDVVSDIIKTI